jgi:hypothetical protein
LQAGRRGQSLEGYLRHLAEKEAQAHTENAEALLNQGVAWLTGRGPEDERAARQRVLESAPSPRDLPAGQTILDVVEGKWPGTETDAEIRDALDRIS